MGTSVMFPMVATASALRVTFSSVWFPATVVTASSSISGLPCASKSAIASSWPGSQSKMIFFAIACLLGERGMSGPVQRVDASAALQRIRGERFQELRLEPLDIQFVYVAHVAAGI